MTDTLDLAALRKQAEVDLELAQKATPNWAVDGRSIVSDFEEEKFSLVAQFGGTHYIQPDGGKNERYRQASVDNLNYAVSARTGWPASARAVLALVAEVERLKTEVARLQELARERVEYHP